MDIVKNVSEADMRDAISDAVGTLQEIARLCTYRAAALQAQLDTARESE